MLKADRDRILGKMAAVIDAKFWKERWRKNEIGFHEPKPNPLLVKYFNRLALKKSARVFVPLCGKTLDIHWLLAKGCCVAGAELSELAVTQLFADLKLQPKISDSRSIRGPKIYSAKNIEIFVGDIFTVTRQKLTHVDAIYDRAALVALPRDVRKRYTDHLLRITNKAPQLLVSFEYDQTLRAGPPFSITNAEIVQRYGKTHDIILLASAELPGGLKGEVRATENFWHLKPK